MTQTHLNQLSKLSYDDLLFIIKHAHLFKQSTASGAMVIYNSKTVKSEIEEMLNYSTTKI